MVCGRVQYYTRLRQILLVICSAQLMLRRKFLFRCSLAKQGAELCLAAGPGFEPRLTGPKPVVLPLDDPARIIHCFVDRKFAEIARVK
jgi:hypothetical protein